MTEAVEYLQGAVGGEYLSLLHSRWAALMPRMGKRTQRLQVPDDVIPIGGSSSVRRELEEDFHLADSLLEAEHGIYRRGQELLQSAREGAEDRGRAPWQQHLELLLQSMLSELCVKETVLADWRATCSTIAPNTLRVYTHALLTQAQVRSLDVDRLVLLVKQSPR